MDLISPTTTIHEARCLLAESIFRPAAVLLWWRATSFDSKSVRRSATVNDTGETTKLIQILDEAAQMGQQVTDKVSSSADPQPTANAASICRWQLLNLRQQLVDMDGPRRVRSWREDAMKHLDAAASAAQALSYGYRLHNLDRICDGGEALDEHLAALARIRTKVAATA